MTGVNASKTQSKQKSRIAQLKSTTAADKQSAGDSIRHVGVFLTSLSFQDFYPCNFNYQFFSFSLLGFWIGCNSLKRSQSPPAAV